MAKYVGLDLRKSSVEELKPLNSWLASKVPGIQSNFVENGQPWAVWDWDGSGKLFVVVMGAPEFIIPGNSWASIYVFNEAGEKQGGGRFQAGYRTLLDSCAKVIDPDLGILVRFHTSPAINGREDVEHFDVALDGARPALVRIATKAGELLPNRYYAPNHELGPPVPFELVRTHLRSGSTVQKLEALTWIAGEHLEAGDDASTWFHERSDVAAAYRRLMLDPEVVALVRALTQDASPPIAAAAKVAASKLQTTSP